MTAGERIQATFLGEATDRRAISLTLSMYGAKLIGCPLEKYYSDPAAYAEGQARARALFGSDVLFSPFVSSVEAEAFGSRVAYFETQPPQVCRPAANSPETFSRLPVPDVDTHPRLRFIREALRKMKETCVGVPVASPVSSPAALPALIFGMDTWLQIFLFDEAGRQRVLEKTTPYIVRFANALLADGADCIVMPLFLALPHVITASLLERLILPLFRSAFARINGPILLHHTGAPILPFIGRLATLPNVAGFVVDPRDGLRRAREAMGPDKVLLGGIDGPSLVGLTREQVDTTCRKVLENRAADPRFILTTTAADLEFDTPPANIRAIRDAAIAFGRGEPR